MPLTVYDYRTDLRNILTTPQIRARFMPLGVGQTARGHSHDLGHEMFLVLQGQAEFEIDGERAILGPGQACIALVDQSHTVRNVGDEEVILYLSVTPHILPTHTFWAAEGEREKPHFNPAAAYDASSRPELTLAELIAEHQAQFEVLAATVAEALTTVQVTSVEMAEAANGEPGEVVPVYRDRLWAALLPVYAKLYDQAQAWNDLAARTVEE
jgi:quercetin dioxygenase-like cupin family protein